MNDGAKEAAKAELGKIAGNLPSVRFNFREGDVVLIPTCAGDVSLEFTTHKGRRVVKLPRSAGAKVRPKK